MCLFSGLSVSLEDRPKKHPSLQWLHLSPLQDTDEEEEEEEEDDDGNNGDDDEGEQIGFE